MKALLMPGITLDKELLRKYLENTCTEAELRQIKQFLQLPELAQALNEVLDEAWEEMEEPALDHGALATYREAFVKLHQEKEEQAIKKHFWQQNWLKYAAVFIFILGAARFYFVSKSAKSVTAEIAFIEKYNPKGQRSTITLSDGSVVYLGSNSKVRFPKVFKGNREMELEGEAFFEVTKDPKHPFIIRTGDVYTKVLGTSFKIESFKAHPIVVSVATGKVRVDRQTDTGHKKLSSIAVLTPGQLVSWNKETETASLGETGINNLEHWKDGNLTFNDERLEDVATILSRSYNIDIEISNEKLANYRINTTCSLTEPINKSMDIICKTGGFKHKINKTSILIY